MFLFYLPFLHLTLSQHLSSSYQLSDCTHLVLPPRCQCYHSGDNSELNCRQIKLDFLPKLPNNMHWSALDFSSNKISSIESYVFSDIYVEKLSLDSNSLYTIALTAFDQIQNLKQLFLNHNQLREFHPNILTSPGVSLEILDMSYNPFEYLDLGGIFLRSPYLKEFYAMSCRLNSSSLDTLLKLSEHHNQYIKLIDLSSNYLTTLCNRFFDSFSSLVELRLNNNYISVIDNYFIRPLNYLQTLNLAYNSIEHVPNLFSSSLETLNFSSNNIRHLNDYFASNLHAIRVIDLDSNKNFNSISPRSFCFINILTLEKILFRSNNIFSLNTSSELLCRLLENTNITQKILDVNHNVNLECDCILTQYEKYLIDYFDLTCTQQGQDRYFISKVTNSFSNCTLDFCMQHRKENLCQWNHVERVMSQVACPITVIENENMTMNESGPMKTTINSTMFYGRRQISMAILIYRLDYSLMIILVFLLYI